MRSWTMGRRTATMLVVCVAVLMGAASCQTERKAPPAPAKDAPAAASPKAPAADKAPSKKAAPKFADADLPDIEYTEIVTGKGEKSDRLPMIVMVHGYGATPDDFKGFFLTNFQVPARVILPKGIKPKGPGFSWFDIVRPIEDGDPKMVAEMERSAAALAKLMRRLRVEKPTLGKPIISGFSQGGMMSFIVAAKHPEVISAAVPIAGWLPPALVPEAELTGNQPAITALHGDADERVKLEPTRQGVEALHAKGLKAELKIYPGVAHRFTPTMKVDFFNIIRKSIEALQ